MPDSHRMRLELLKQKSIDLARLASPWQSRTTQIYPHLKHEDIKIICADFDLSHPRVAELTAATGLTEDSIAHILGQFIRLDFINFHSIYHDFLIEYRRSKVGGEQIASYLTEAGSGGDTFLLHGTIYVWDHFSGDLDELRIEGEHEGDAFPDAVAGYLIEHNLAYETTLDLLMESYTRSWTEWKSLWLRL